MGYTKLEPSPVNSIVGVPGFKNAFVKYPPRPAATATITRLMMNTVLLIPPRLTICPETLVISDQCQKLEYCVINRPTDYTERLRRDIDHNSETNC